MTMNPKNRSDLGIANSDCSYLRPEALCQNGCCIWVFWWILPTKFNSHSQHEWISPKWLWHMRCPIGTACMGILIKNCVSEICIIIWQVCGAYGVKTPYARQICNTIIRIPEIQKFISICIDAAPIGHMKCHNNFDIVQSCWPWEWKIVGKMC